MKNFLVAVRLYKKKDFSLEVSYRQQQSMVSKYRNIERSYIKTNMKKLYKIMYTEIYVPVLFINSDMIC